MTKNEFQIEIRRRITGTHKEHPKALDLSFVCINCYNTTINIKSYPVFPSKVTANIALYFVEYLRNSNNWESR